MNQTRLDAIRKLSDNAALLYDEDGRDRESGFFKAQAADFVRSMALVPGSKVLDLGCGAGWITILAARAVAPSGSVVAVDISPRHLGLARAKVEKENLSVTFLECDMEKVAELDGVEDGAFDAIACASAMVYMQDPEACVQKWARLLKKRGRLVFDTPAYDSAILFRCFDVVRQKLNMAREYRDMATMGKFQKTKQMLDDAGLDPFFSFVSRDYVEFRDVEEIDATRGGEVFEAAVLKNGWQEEFFMPGVAYRAKDTFCRELNKFADAHGKVTSYLRFNVAIGYKII